MKWEFKHWIFGLKLDKYEYFQPLEVTPYRCIAFLSLFNASPPLFNDFSLWVAVAERNFMWVKSRQLSVINSSFTDYTLIKLSPEIDFLFNEDSWGGPGYNTGYSYAHALQINNTR